MDVSGAEALGRVIEDLQDLGVPLVLARVRMHVRQTLQTLGLEEKIGPGTTSSWWPTPYETSCSR
jgi:anti-anti-sigma regulatory factor